MKPVSSPFWRRLPTNLLSALLGTGMVGMLGGCVERSITVVTSPPGAKVYLNDVEQGTSPAKIPFEWYGVYDVRLRATKNIGTPEHPKLVYYYLHTHKTAHAPWFQWIGPDLIAAILPMHFKDDKIWAFILPQVPEDSASQLIKNANELKAQLPPLGKH